MFEVQIKENAKSFLDGEKIKMIGDTANKYMAINNTVAGKEFFETFILASSKDYSTDDMRYLF